MRVVGRLFWALLGLAFAIPCGAVILALAVLIDPVSSEVFARLGLAGFMQGMTDLASGIGPETILLFLAALARAGFVLLVLPPVAMALIGEAMALRGALAYACGTGLLTALVPWMIRGTSGTSGAGGMARNLAVEGRLTALLFLAGAATGLVYGWIVLGNRREA